MHDLLSAIVACARAIVERRRAATPAGALLARASLRPPRGPVFRAALANRARVNIIAECKRRSPSHGVLAPDYQPEVLARRYEQGGAAAVSVLTEPCFFDGSLEHLSRVREAVECPLLRKDFIVDEYQLYEAAASGADAVLLIVAALGRDALPRLMAAAGALDLAALVEVHSAEELSRALDAGADLIGVNSRNLRTLRVDAAVCDEVIPLVPQGCVAVAESGLKSAADVRRLREVGYHAFLIGEWLMTAPDPASVVAGLTEGANA